MAGTKEGGKKTAATNKAKFGEDYYRNIGKLGGRVNHRETRHFYLNRDVASNAGTMGGQRSRRGPAKKESA